MSTTAIQAKIIKGHQVASGLAQNTPFPEGTIKMQWAFFSDIPDIEELYNGGTVNLDINPYHFKAKNPVHRKNITWFENITETFLFWPVKLTLNDCDYSGLIYYPDPADKYDHFKPDTQIELLLPYIDGLSYDTDVTIELESELISKAV